MTYREVQAIMIVVVCIATIIFSARFVLHSPMRGTVYYWVRVFQLGVVAYVGALYLIATLNLSTVVFGPGGVAMGYFRPAILLLLVTIMLDWVWRYRADI